MPVVIAAVAALIASGDMAKAQAPEGYSEADWEKDQLEDVLANFDGVAEDAAREINRDIDRMRGKRPVLRVVPSLEDEERA